MDMAFTLGLTEEYFIHNLQIYEGEWLENKMHNRGIYSWKDGRKYEGEYQQDLKHGFGVY